jgi:hypothetical protein
MIQIVERIVAIARMSKGRTDKPSISFYAEWPNLYLTKRLRWRGLRGIILVSA